MSSELSVPVAPPMSSPGVVKTTLADLRAGWGRRDLWWALAYQDLVAQYRRSIIGPFWITLQMSAFVFGIALIYSSLFQTDFLTFLPYVALGFLVWGFIAGLVGQSTTSYTGEANFIRSMALPLSIYAFRLVASQMWLFLHNVLPVIVLLAVLRVVPSPWAIIEVPAAIVLILINGLFLAMWLGPLAARYRDLTPLVASAMSLLMFLTPVFWDPTTGTSRKAVLWNPFAYFLDSVRSPLLNRPTGLLLWSVVIGVTILNIIVGVIVFGRSRRWIAHWVG